MRGTMTTFDFDYDTDTDFLEITDQDAGDNYKFSVNIGEVGINVAHSGEIMSVEVMNASQIFDIDPDQLDQLNDVEIEVEQRGPTVMVKVRVTYDEGRKASQYGVQLDQDTLAQAPA